MKRIEDWPEGWGILFAAYATPDKIFGTVRLNKYLALMQREGLPIENRFIIEEMGPYDKNITLKAEEFREKGLLAIESKKTVFSHPMQIYEITDKGKKYTEEKILPLFNKMPHQIGFKSNLSSVTDFVIFNKIDHIVKKIHKELYLDDNEQFLNELRLIQQKIENKFNELEKKPMDFCNIFLDYLGYFEFTNNALKIILEKMQNDKYIGKNNVLYNSIKLFERYEVLKKFYDNQLKDCISKNNCSKFPCPVKDEMLNHRFSCIEYNSNLYKIKKSLDHIDTDFRELFSTNNS